MEYTEQASSHTLYPFQNKHQIHRHLQIVKMLCALKIKIQQKSQKMGQTHQLTQRFLNNVLLSMYYSIPLIYKVGRASPTLWLAATALFRRQQNFFFRERDDAASDCCVCTFYPSVDNERRNNAKNISRKVAPRYLPTYLPTYVEKIGRCSLAGMQDRQYENEQQSYRQKKDLASTY